ncbi:MAG TPA: 5'-nucleotidase C-terminal domain-containing protein, partial [Thermoanaerobaculia bacterium]|nr:5'-nucleotidase C-terminal domain-containing protein [Thermoanaerobaculia bacterium]
NDVYRIEGVEGGAVGGLARLRTLREELERSHPDLVVLHAGDLLFPSLLSRVYAGEQMIDVLNRLDGDPAAFDPRLFVVFGNHEFDRGKPADAAMLDARVEESQFTWVASNVVFDGGAESTAPTVAAPNLRAHALVESGGLEIGVFGLTIDVTKPAYVARFLDPLETARASTAELRAAGADLVVGLTHLDWRDDERILATLGADGPDLLIGGHDHERMTKWVEGRLLAKADADARTATVARVTRYPDGRVAVLQEFRALEEAQVPSDPEVNAAVADWLDRHEKKLCGDLQLAGGCLADVLGRTRTELEGEETAIRSRETSLGDWVADAMVEALAPCGAQAAFVNSGSLRLNQDLAAGSEITRRHLEELFGFPTPLRLIRLDGATLAQVVRHAVDGWPGKGQWLQVSGFAFVHDPEAATATALTRLGPEGPRPLRPDEELLVVATDFLLDPAGGQDGYTMLRQEMTVPCAAAGGDLKNVVREALAAAEPQGIAPAVEGRICRAPVAADCKAVSVR